MPEVQEFPSLRNPWKAIDTPMQLDDSTDGINSRLSSSLRRSSYEIDTPFSFFVPNAANMASIIYQRQRHEFDLPLSPFQKRPATSTARKPLKKMNIPQMLYTKKAPAAPSKPVCVNCKDPGLELKDCEEPCGLCDRARHTAGDCTFRLR